MVPDSGAVWVAERSFPVLLCAGGETVFQVTGGPSPHDAGGRVVVEGGCPTSAFFLTYSRHVAALLAEALRVPLVDESDARSYAVGEIPGHWRDPESVRVRMMWRSQ